jgi:hypothetical protein
MNIIANRNCTTIVNSDNTETIIRKCSKNPVEIKDLNTIVPLKVFKALYNNEDIIIKIIRPIDPSDTNNLRTADQKRRVIQRTLKEVDEIVTFSYNMDKWKLGPKVLDAFYILNESEPRVDQFIIMKRFPFNCEDILKDPNFEKKPEIIHQMISIIRSMIFDHGLYCMDIKPNNFIVSINPNMDVRMIDFDDCTVRLGHFNIANETEFFDIMLFQLYIYVLSYRLPFNTNNPTESGYGVENRGRDFLNAIFCKYFSSNMVENILKHTDNPYIHFHDYLVLAKASNVFDYQTNFRESLNAICSGSSSASGTLASSISASSTSVSTKKQKLSGFGSKRKYKRTKRNRKSYKKKKNSGHL